MITNLSKVAEPKPELATNRAGRTVAEALSGYITHAATGFVGGARLDIASAYFNVGGYSLLADSLDHLTGARLLLGAEPTPPERRPRTLGDESARPERAAAARLRRALEGHERDLTTDRDLLGFSVETDAAVRRLVAWLQSGRVQVRRLEGRFLHGKAFLVSDRSHGVVAGSSNFTRAGLATNLELNLGNYSPHVVRQVQEWFEELWAEAVDYDLAALFEGRFEPHPPQIIYLRMLRQLYGDDIDTAADGKRTLRHAARHRPPNTGHCHRDDTMHSRRGSADSTDNQPLRLWRQHRPPVNDGPPWRSIEASVGRGPATGLRCPTRDQGSENLGVDFPSGILSDMPDSTTIKVSVRTRDALRQLADREGLTFDAQLEKLIRRERRRIIGAQLASAPLEADEQAVLDASAGDVADASG